MIKNVYFHIDEIGRDAITASALKKAFAKKNINLVYGNRVYTNKLLENFLLAFDLIILPRPQFLKNFKNINKKIPPVIILYTESVGRVVSENNDKFTLFSLLDKDFMEGKTQYVDKVSAFCLWGESGINRIKNYYPEIAYKFFVTGHPRHDKMCIKLKIQDNNSTKPKVGLITRQPLLNDFLQRRPIDSILKRHATFDKLYDFKNRFNGDFLLSQDNEPVDEIYIEATDIEILLSLLIKLNRNGHEVFLKVHPREDKNLWAKFIKTYNLNVSLAHWRTPFAHWIQKLDYVIGPSSTSYYDCCVAGVQPICTRKINKYRDLHLKDISEENGALMKHIITPNTLDEILEIVSKKNNKFDLSPDIKKVLYKETNFPQSLDSIDKIVEVSLSYIKKNSVNLFIKKIYMLAFNFYGNFVINPRIKFSRFLRKQTDQGSTFLLTKNNIKYIDDLVD